MRGLSSRLCLHVHGENARRRAAGLRLCGLAATSLVAAVLLAVAIAPTSRAATVHDRGATSHTITYDKYSLMIDGKRTFIWSGEFEYWRLPSPSLWLDILQKMKAEGYNAVTIYFDWAYHSPAPGVYDFSGRARRQQAARRWRRRSGSTSSPGRGRTSTPRRARAACPGWLTTQAGKARTDAPDYEAAADDWLHHIDAILRNHQLTNGTGTVILYQIENELADTGSGEFDYMQNLYDTARSDGITVPIFHNDKGRNGIWVPAGSGVPGTVTGPNDLYAFDGYPGRHVQHRRHARLALRRARLGDLGPRRSHRRRPARRRTRPGSPPSSAAAGSTTGAARAPTTAWPSARARVTSASSTRRTSPTGSRIQNFYMTVRRHVVGVAAGAASSTPPTTTARRSTRRASCGPRPSTMKEIGLFLQSVAPVITKVRPGRPRSTPSSPRSRSTTT